jgi:xanthine dehydrogenase accessory factor
MTNTPDFFERLSRLKRDGESFTTATVVSRRAPVSSHIGDRAIIFADGRMEGFVGGSCSREIVRKQALEALRLGKPRLVLIRPDATLETLQHAAEAESIVVPMTCASEGAADVYLEPHTRARVLLVAGFTPVAQAVANLGGMLELEVVRVVTREELRDLEATPPEGASWGQDAAPCKLVALQDVAAYLESLPESTRVSMAAVVASQGHYDEPVLELLLNAKVGFVGLLASRKRAVTVRELLELQGMDVSLTIQIRNPIGLDINAKTPSEVAVSILAEIIAARDSDTPMFTNSSGYNAQEYRAKKQNVSSETSAIDVVGARHASPLRDDAAQTNSHEMVGGSSKSNDHEATQPNIFGLSLERPGYALSPVDAEEIEIASAVHFAELEGVTYYFSCPNCKRRFLKNPSAYLEPQNVVAS